MRVGRPEFFLHTNTHAARTRTATHEEMDQAIAATQLIRASAERQLFSVMIKVLSAVGVNIGLSQRWNANSPVSIGDAATDWLRVDCGTRHSN